MLYAIFCYDKPDSFGIRKATRPAHLEYLADAGERVKLGGPLLSAGEDGMPVGSMLIIDAASEAAVQLFADNDPYNTAGLFERVEIRPWKRVTGAWGGER